MTAVMGQVITLLHYLKDNTFKSLANTSVILSYMCPGHDIKLHPHRMKLYRIGCVGSDLVLK